MEIIIIVIIVIGIILLNKYIINIIHKTENKIEKSLYVVMLAITDMFLVIYYSDRFNLATRLNMNENVDTQNWLNNISNVFANIVSASIGGIIAYGIASSEIKENNKQNKENNRIQNMPLLKYDIKTEGKDKKIDGSNLIGTKYENTENSNSYDLFINIKNIGMNNIKQMIVELESDCFLENDRILNGSSQNPLEKNESIKIYKFFNLEKEKNYNMVLKVSYEDVLLNWYSQEVEIVYYTTNFFDSSSNYKGKIEYVVKNEKLEEGIDVK